MAELAGILALEGTRITGAGSMFDATLLGPTEIAIVPGATTVAVMDAPETAAPAFVEGALSLAGSGCDLITSNCGLSAGFQGPVAAATGLPTALSSLLLTPLLWRVFDGGLGVLTYASVALTVEVRRASGWGDDVTPVIGEVRPLASWRLLECDANLERGEMRANLLAVAADVVERGGNRALLVECAAMLPFLRDLREGVRLPIYSIFDLLSLIRKGMPDGD